MGAETFLYGYICLTPSGHEHNQGVFARWPFDPLYPFPNIFSGIHNGYGGDIVSFAGSLKSLHEVWDDWEVRFESLLFKLLARTARVHLEHETDGNIKSVAYVCEAGWDTANTLQDRLWSKCSYGDDGLSGDGVTIHES